MKVAYLDLGFSREEYCLQPTRYGGGGVVARYLKEDPEVDLHVFAPPEAFKNVGVGERHDRCHGLTVEAQQWLRRGGPLDAIPGMADAGFDLILHPHTCETVNRGTLTCPIVHWSGFDGTAGHPGNDYILLYDDTFKPLWGQKAKYVRIGKPVPATYTPHPKAGYVFQCSRHDDHMNSLEVARQCLRYGIPGYFAGPIHNGYPLMEHIDGMTTHYLGEVDEATKLAYCRHARLFCLAHQWPSMPFNQSIIEAQGQGTPIWATRLGPFLTRYLEPGVNGWDAAETTLLEAFNAAAQDGAARQRVCWDSARAYDVSVMCRTFREAFREIVAEWDAR